MEDRKEFGLEKRVSIIPKKNEKQTKNNKKMLILGILAGSACFGSTTIIATVYAIRYKKTIDLENRWWFDMKKSITVEFDNNGDMIPIVIGTWRGPTSGDESQRGFAIFCQGARFDGEENFYFQSCVNKTTIENGEEIVIEGCEAAYYEQNKSYKVSWDGTCTDLNGDGEIISYCPWDVNITFKGTRG